MSLPDDTPTVTVSPLARVTTTVACLTVTLAAVAATAHGVYSVAVASGVPVPVAWLYPLITDGLALTAYAATRRLNDSGRRYAWLVVVVAAALSGVAQAAFLAGGVAATPVGLRFGVGAWPALAGVTAAHLLYLTAHPAAAAVTPVLTAPATEPLPAPARPAVTVTPVGASARDREALRLRNGDMSWPDIAARLGCDKRTAMRGADRARNTEPADPARALAAV